MENKEYDKLLKLTIIGDAKSGKSCFLQRFSGGKFTETYLPTIGVDFMIKTLEVKDKRIKLQMWDTSGQDRFKSISSSYYKGTNIIILLYDITNIESFNNLESHIKNIDDLSKVQICILGNKSDLVDNDSNYRAVDSQAGLEFASKYNALFMEVSAKNNTNIDSAINEAVSCWLTKMD